MIIYLTGIDGSGKSTITKKLETEIVKGEVVTIWARYKPKLVKKLIAPFKKKFVKDVKKDYLMDGKEYSQWTSYKSKLTKSGVLSKGLFLLQSIDYSYQLREFKTLLNSHDKRTVIVDRYLLDFIVDQSVNYGDISESPITKWCLKRLSKLDFIFFIDTKEEIAMSRKDDIPSIEYLRQRKYYYLQYISKLRNGHVVTNNADISQTMNEIESIIYHN